MLRLSSLYPAMRALNAAEQNLRRARLREHVELRLQNALRRLAVKHQPSRTLD
jgi:hypothetical protein